MSGRAAPSILPHQNAGAGPAGEVVPPPVVALREERTPGASDWRRCCATSGGAFWGRLNPPTAMPTPAAVGRFLCYSYTGGRQHRALGLRAAGGPCPFTP